MLRLSRWCLPQVQHGRRPLIPSNMSPGPDRLAYLDGLLENAALLLREGVPASEVEAWIERVPMGAMLVALVGEGPSTRVVERPDARTRVSFDPEALGIAILDGRARARRATAHLPTGRATPRYARWLSALIRGIEARALAELGGPGHAFPRLIALLRARGQLEEVEAAPSMETAPARSKPDAVTWLGHASVQVESRGAVVWVDPLLVPDIQWTEADARTLFSSTHAETRLFDPRGSELRPRPLADLPTPDAVLITHQDRDHFDLGVLMALPDSTEIVVPRADPRRPWEVDLEALIHRVLGPGRRVRVAAPGDRFWVRDLEVLVLPFSGEMPSALEHGWNTYLLRGASHRALFMADARLDADLLERLAAEHQRDPAPMVLFAGAPRAPDVLPGWREGLTALDVFSGDRLWGWYLPPARLFEPVRASNVTREELGALRARAGLESYFPYAMGSTPWFRIEDPTDAFALPVTSLEQADLERIEAMAADAGVRLFTARYGQAVELTQASAEVSAGLLGDPKKRKSVAPST